jgi:hypothetical protein
MGPPLFFLIEKQPGHFKRVGLHKSFAQQVGMGAGWSTAV